MTRTQGAAATNKKRNNSQEHAKGLELQGQLKAYAVATAEAKKNGTPRPFWKDFSN